MDPNGIQTLKETNPGGLGSVARRVAQNPNQLRVFLMLGTFSVWYIFFSMPMSAEIDDTGKKTVEERKRVALAIEVEKLRQQVGLFEGRLPKNTDSNEWVHYMMEGVRKFPVRQTGLETEGIKDLGPFKVIVLKLHVEGSFHDVDHLLRWIDGNERLLRIDSIKAEPSRAAPGKVDVLLQILGVMG
jgi:hypothetical protein